MPIIPFILFDIFFPLKATEPSLLQRAGATITFDGYSREHRVHRGTVRPKLGFSKHGDETQRKWWVGKT